MIQGYLELNLNHETIQVIQANYETMHSLAKTFTDPSMWISRSPIAQVFSNGVGDSHLDPATQPQLLRFNNSIVLVGAIVFGIPQDKLTDSYNIIRNSVEKFALFEGLGGGRRNAKYGYQSSLLAHTLKVLSNVVCELLTARPH